MSVFGFGRRTPLTLANALRMSSSIKRKQVPLLLQVDPKQTAAADVKLLHNRDIKQFAIGSAASVTAAATGNVFPAALEPQYGNKYEGIKESEALIKALNLTGVATPATFGLSHQQVKRLILSTNPKIIDDWKTLCETFEKFSKENKAAPVRFLQQKEVQALLEKLQKAIESCFDSKAVVPAEMTAWIAEMHQKKVYLMVRSSGFEDLESCANAGGNLSVPYVEPSSVDVLKACGRVVASYFSENSLRNQLQSNLNPFTRLPLIPVLLQELIGEKEGVVPVAVVLITSEPSYSKDNFRVTKMTSTFGHGEAVVNNKGIMCDTALVVRSASDPKKYVELYQNQDKVRRLVPATSLNTGKIVLCDIMNEQRSKLRSLDTMLVTRLAQLADAIEKHYKAPRNLELVVKNGIIYVVQNRAYNALPSNTPSYWQTNSIEPEFQTAAKVLVARQNAVVKIESDSEILVSPTLKQAEELYQKGTHKLIIVGQDEPALSHPVVNFSSTDVVCVYHTDWKAFEKKVIDQRPIEIIAAEHALLTCDDNIEVVKSKNPIFVCPQSGQIYLWDNTKGSGDACVVSGFYTHPAPMNISLDSPQQSEIDTIFKIESSLTAQCRNVINSLKVVKTSQLAFEKIKLLSDMLSAHLSQQAKAIQEAKKYQLASVTKTMHAIEQLQIRCKQILDELAAVHKEEHPKLERLFYIKALETLIGMHPQNGLETITVMDIEPLVVLSKQLMQRQAQLSTPLQLERLHTMREYAFVPAQSLLWDQFLLGLEKALAAKQIKMNDIQELMKSLESLDANNLTMWFHAIFLPALNVHKDAVALARTLLQDLTGENLGFFLITRTHYLDFSYFENNIAEFAQPNKIMDMWDMIKKRGVVLSDPEKFIKQYHNGSKLACLMALQAMKRYVKIVDLAIKTMKMGPYTDDEKVKYMSMMLSDSFAVMKQWITDFFDEKDKRNRGYPIESCVRSFKHIIESAPKSPSAALVATPGWSVNSAMITSGANASDFPPQTLEDLFTLIHQNQLAVIAKLNTLLFSESMSFPHELTNILHVFRSSLTKRLVSVGLKLQWHGVETTRETFQVSFNCPLNNHGANIEVIQRKNNSELTVNVDIYAVQMQNDSRTHDINDLVDCLNDVKILFLQKPIRATESNLSFSWKVRSKDDMDIIENCLYAFLTKISRNRSVYEELYAYLKNRNMHIHMGEWFLYAGINRDSDMPSKVLIGKLIKDFVNSPKGPDAMTMLIENMGKSADQRKLQMELDRFCRLFEIHRLTQDGCFPKIKELINVGFSKYLNKHLNYSSVVEQSRRDPAIFVDVIADFARDLYNRPGNVGKSDALILFLRMENIDPFVPHILNLTAALYAQYHEEYLLDNSIADFFMAYVSKGFYLTEAANFVLASKNRAEQAKKSEKWLMFRIGGLGGRVTLLEQQLEKQLKAKIVVKEPGS